MNFTLISVDRDLDSGIVLNRLINSLLSDFLDVPEGRVEEGMGRRAGSYARHIGDTIMHDAFIHEDGIGVRRRSRGLHIATLVYADIHDQGTRLHQLKVFTADE